MNGSSARVFSFSFRRTMSFQCEQDLVLSEVHITFRPQLTDELCTENKPFSQEGKGVSTTLTRFPVKLPLQKRRLSFDRVPAAFSSSGFEDGHNESSKDVEAEARCRRTDSVVEQDEDGDCIVVRTMDRDDVDIITIEHAMETSLPDVGLQVWFGSLLLCNFILYEHQRFSNCIALELGAGTGLASIAMAMTAKYVICTDVGEGVLNMCLRNIQNNCHLCREMNEVKRTNKSIIVRELDWMSPEVETDELRPFHWKQKDIELLNDVDVIFAGDVIYDNTLTDAFFQKLQALMTTGKPKTCYIALERRLNFTVEDLDVTCKEYDHFGDAMTSLQSNPQFTAVQRTAEFPKHIKFPCSKYLELWEIKRNFPVP